ncbi:MAG: ribonuclease P protein component [Sediminibacterium sp.]|jgi:ribonuclease P protein component|nr:ribonuclease P protein component [Sediminibacterium sp.]
MAGTFSYNKFEKLKSRKQIELLFAKGKSISAFPVKVFYLPVEHTPVHPVQVGVGVSARNFKKAVDRNTIKRRMREAYRLHKLPLHEHLVAQQKSVAVFILWIDKQMPTTAALQDLMPAVIEKLIKQLG